MSNIDVLIIGAGPTGLAMASQCIRYDINFRIIEKRKEPSKESRALAIHARTMEVLHYLGLGETFAERGLPLKGINIYIEGEKKGDFSLGDLDTPYPYVLSLDQSDTERILEKHLKKNKIKVEREKELIKLKQKNGKVEAIVKSKNGKEEKINPRYLIACDGAHSTVRHELDLDFGGGKYPETLALADVEVDWPGGVKEGASVFVRKDGVMALIPLIHKNRYRFLCTLPEEREECTLDLVRRISDDRAIEGLKYNNPVWMSVFSIHHRYVSRMREGNVFLLGDAAHIHSPAGGQGMNIGIHETDNLAWKLKLVLEDRADDKLLDTFNEERYPITKSVVRFTDITTRMMILNNPIAKALKSFMFSLLGNSDIVQKRMKKALSEIEIDYRGSSLIIEDWNGSEGIEAGERAPDVNIPGKGRLFNLLQDGNHQILLFTGDSEKIIKFKENLSRSVNVHPIRNTTDELISKYGIEDEGVYIIRPDGHIGLRSKSTDLHICEEYFNKIASLSD